MGVGVESRGRNRSAISQQEIELTLHVVQMHAQPPAAGVPRPRHPASAPPPQVAALTNIVSYWVLAIPLAHHLAFARGMGLQVSLCLVLQSFKLRSWQTLCAAFWGVRPPMQPMPARGAAQVAASCRLLQPEAPRATWPRVAATHTSACAARQPPRGWDPPSLQGLWWGTAAANWAMALFMLGFALRFDYSGEAAAAAARHSLHRPLLGASVEHA